MARWPFRLGAGIATLAAIGWFISAPPRADAALADLTGDAEAGALTFAAAGCASCHTAPEAEAVDLPVLSGGRAFATDFGTFYAPNISPHPEQGIGGWSDAEIIHAIRTGVSPEGYYYYPAFPSHAYALAEPQDIADIVAHLRRLPADATPSVPHDVGFPFNIRRSLWGWRLLFGRPTWTGPGGDGSDPQLDRGRYLAEALGHCAECHTPRGALGGLQRGRWMSGAAFPHGEGRVPGLTPAQLDWSASDIANYLGSGFTPEFDVAGGAMVDVIENLSRLPKEDLEALAAYVKALPAAE